MKFVANKFAESSFPSSGRMKMVQPMSEGMHMVKTKNLLWPLKRLAYSSYALGAMNWFTQKYWDLVRKSRTTELDPGFQDREFPAGELVST